MATRPSKSRGSSDANIAQPEIKVDGAAISNELMSSVLTIEWRTSLNSIPRGLIEMAQWSGDLYAWYGKEIEIKFDEGGEAYKGEVVRVHHANSSTQNYKCTIEVRPKPWRLGAKMNFESFIEMSVNDIVNAVIADCGVSGTVDSTSITHKYILQCNESNLNFIHRLLEDEGLCFWIDNDAKFKASMPLKFSTAKNVKPEEVLAIAAEHFPTYAKLEVAGWDYDKKEAVTDQGSIPKSNAISSNATTIERSPSILEKAQVSEWKKGMVARLEGDRSLVRGTVIATELQIDNKIDFSVRAGLNDWQKMQVGIIETVIRIDQSSGMVCDFIGVDLSSKENSASEYLPCRSAPRPVIAGVHPALVTSIEDPDAWGRVKIKFPAWNEEVEGPWARMSQPMAGTERGTLFYPRIDDEVLVMFTDGDPSHPVIIGSLYNGKDKPIEPACGPHQESDEAVGTSIYDGHHELSFKSKGGEEGMWLQADGGVNGLVFSTPDKTIDLTSTDGTITIHADTKIILESGSAKITLDGMSGDIKIEGMNIELKADLNITMDASLNLEGKGAVGLALEGGATAELKGGAQTTVKGGMVMIN